MKKSILLSIILLLTTGVSAQSPDLFSYQAVVRDNAGKVIASTAVSFRFSILQTTATGTAQYVETHNPTTDANGLVSLMIGGGTVSSGTFASIDWATDKYFLKVELDPAGGTSFSSMGTTQLISVPYAKHAETAARAEVATRIAGGNPGGGSGIGAGGSANLSNFDNDFSTPNKIGEGFELLKLESDAQKNLYIVGSFNTNQIKLGLTAVSLANVDGSLFLAKLDSSFNLIWAKYGNLSFNQGSLITDNAGNSFIAMETQNSSVLWDGNTYQIPSGNRRGLILKVDNTGNVSWSKGYSTTQWGNDRDHICLGLNTNSELLLSMTVNGISTFGSDAFNMNSADYGLYKITANGSSTTLLDSATGVAGESIVLDNLGNTYVVLFGKGSNGVAKFKTQTITVSGRSLLVKYDNTYAIIDSNNSEVFGSGKYKQSRNLQFDGANIYHVGATYNFNLGGTYYPGFSNPYISKYDQNLNLISSDVVVISGIGHAQGFGIKSNGDINFGIYTFGSYVINDVNHHPLSSVDNETQQGASFSLTYSNSLTVKNHKPLKLFQPSKGMLITVEGNTAYLGATIDGSFYNKGTKYTPGVYLFKE